MPTFDTAAFLARARVRIFSEEAVTRVTDKSHTTHWRRRKAGNGEPVLASRMGADVVAFMQAEREAAKLPPIAEADVLTALEIEQADVVRAKAAARAKRATANVSGMTEVTV